LPLRLNTTATGQSTCGRFFVKEKYYKLAEGAIRQGMAKPLAGTTRVCKGLVLMQMLYTAIAPLQGKARLLFFQVPVKRNELLVRSL
jgi:hypothetical protein